MVPIRAAPPNGLTLEYVFYENYGTYEEYMKSTRLKGLPVYDRNSHESTHFKGERIIQRFDNPLEIDYIKEKCGG